MSINLTVPSPTELKPRITVFGVGGGGGNAVNNMIESNLQGVEFVVANTDAQALMQSLAERRVQMGSALTEGLGAGSQPQIGAGAAEEALPEITDHLAGAHMVFITAGMGGGTGTGAAPVIARVARELGILTVGVVTKPFHFEGQRRLLTAERGIEQLANHVDTLIVIPNQNLFRVANEKTTFAAAFAMADQVLYSGVASVTELMTKEGLINLDFADVRAIMSGMGKAMMGTGEATGEKRAVEAAEAAISNPLLDDFSMQGAKGLLISISGGPDLTLYEVDEAATRIREEVDLDANIILGATFDDTLEGAMRVSVVATGLTEDEQEQEQSADTEAGADRTGGHAIYTPGFAREAVQAGSTPFSPAPDPARKETLHAVAGDDADETGYHRRSPVSSLAPSAPRRNEQAENSSSSDRAHDAARTDGRRLPEYEDFPPLAQRQLAARRDARLAGDGNVRPESVRPAPRPVTPQAQQSPQRRGGLLERLSSVGFGRKTHDEADDAQEPRHTPTLSGLQPDHSGDNAVNKDSEAAYEQAYDAENRIDPGLNEEQLEIPAFLRRQAN